MEEAYLLIRYIIYYFFLSEIILHFINPFYSKISYILSQKMPLTHVTNRIPQST